MFYLIDLERTIGIGRTFYWKAHGRGYTTLIEEAGLYPEAAAKEQVESDIDHRTIMVAESVVKGIFKK